MYAFIVQEGYVWILLDGGPSRAFSDSDITMMEEDFNLLKVSCKNINLGIYA